MLSETDKSEMQSLQIGDVVSLNSGSPAMTVLQVQYEHGVEKAAVSWFGEGENCHTGVFPVACLKRAACQTVVNS